MLNIYVKYFFLMICNCYVYPKLLHVTLSKKKLFASFIFSAVYPLFYYYIGLFFPTLNIFIAIVIFAIFMILIYHHNIKLSFITAVITVAINYFLFTLITIPSIFVFYFTKADSDNAFNYSILLFCVGTIHFFLIHIIFRIPRLKSGMPFLFHGLSSDYGLLISSLIIVFMTLISNYDFSMMPLFSIIIFSVILGFFLYMWWKHQLKKNYIEKLKLRKYELLEKQYKKILDDNSTLSAIIHRNNKLVPSIGIALNNFLSAYNEGDYELIKSLGEDLSKYIEEFNTENQSFISLLSDNSNAITSTNNIIIDSVISYLDKRASDINVTFTFKCYDEIAPIFNGIIKDTAFTTLLSDLGENAIIATQNIMNGKVLISLTSENGHYILNVYDNGDFFDPQVLLNMGLFRYTTHKSTGGSGIGLMTTYSILTKYYASFILDETIDDTYTKKISICFDGLNQYKIKTNRDEIKNLASMRKDIIIL